MHIHEGRVALFVEVGFDAGLLNGRFGLVFTYFNARTNDAIINVAYPPSNGFSANQPENVGSIMRAAGCYGVNTVFYTGKRYERAVEFRTDTKQVHLQLPLIGVEDLQQVIPFGCVPVAIEVHPDAKPLTEYQHPERAFYIFGPEDGTLDPARFKAVQEVIYVPTHGCMYLAASVNVILYDRLAKQLRAK